jgi:hypothetical protein
VGFPNAGVSVWAGQFGGALVIASPEVYAVTSDGTQHPL